MTISYRVIESLREINRAMKSLKNRIFKNHFRINQNTRWFTLQILFIFLFSILVHRLFDLQIVNGQNMQRILNFRQLEL